VPIELGQCFGAHYSKSYIFVSLGSVLMWILASSKGRVAGLLPEFRLMMSTRSLTSRILVFFACCMLVGVIDRHH